jgi:hypothetical protein
MTQSEKQRLLEQAAKLYGRDPIAAELKINRPLLDSWMDGRAPMPDRMLLALANALVRLAGKAK